VRRVGHAFNGPLLRDDEEEEEEDDEEDDDDDDLWLCFWISYRLRARADAAKARALIPAQNQTKCAG